MGMERGKIRRLENIKEYNFIALLLALPTGPLHPCCLCAVPETHVRAQYLTFCLILHFAPIFLKTFEKCSH